MIKTTKLNGFGQFTKVLAKDNGEAYKAVNFKQVNKKVQKVREMGIACEAMDRGRCKYVQIL
jgi:predicted peroxiredoxin